MKTPEEIGANTLAVLAAQGARQREAAAPLRADIRALMLPHPKQPARVIRRLLTRDYRRLTDESCPSLRRVQEIMRELIRGTVGVAHTPDT